MSFVAIQFPLPTVSSGAAIAQYPFAPGRCTADRKRGILTTAIKPRSSSIRRTARRTRLSIVPAHPLALSGFFSSILKVATGVTTGIITGIPGGPVGMVVGGAAGGISSGLSSTKKPAAAPATPLGPLAGLSTGVIVATVLSFSALFLVLAARGGKQ